MTARTWFAGALAGALLFIGAWSAQSAEPITARGLVRADAALTLIAQSSGLVLEVPFLPGDRIEPGQPVARLDDHDARMGLELAKADVETAELGLKKVKDGARPEDILKAKAAYEEATAGLALAEKTLAADEELFTQGLVSALSRQRSERALDQARAIVETRRLDLLLLEKGPRAEDIRLAEIELERRRMALIQRERQLERTTVAANRDGTASLVRVHVTEGQWVDAGRPVAELVYMETLRIDLDLPAAEVRRLVRGTTAVVRSAAYPDIELAGAVESVAPVVDAAAGSIRVTVTFPNPDHAILPGVEAQVELRP